MAQVDFSQLLYDIETGETLKDPTKQKAEGATPAYPQGRIIQEGPDMKLGTACVNLLKHAEKDEKGDALTNKTSLRFYVLAASIQDSMNKEKKLTLKAEDITLLKTLLSTFYRPVVAGPCMMLLEGMTPYRPPAKNEAEDPAGKIEGDPEDDER